MNQNKIIKIFLAILIITILPIPAYTYANTERDNKIDQFITYLYNKERPKEVERIVDELKSKFPNDPYFNILVAKALWQRLEEKTAHNKSFDEIISYKLVAPHHFLVERFYREISNGLNKTENAHTPKEKYLRGTLFVLWDAFIEKFERGLKSHSEADKKISIGFRLMKEAYRENPNLCSVKYFFAAGKYLIITKSGFFDKIAISYLSKTYKILGGNFNKNDAWIWIRESIKCRPKYYFTKDIEWGEIFFYKQMLLENHRPPR